MLWAQSMGAVSYEEETAVSTGPGACLLWNYEEVLDICRHADNVVATITGHAHQVATGSLLHMTCYTSSRKHVGSTAAGEARER